MTQQAVEEMIRRREERKAKQAIAKDSDISAKEWEGSLMGDAPLIDSDGNKY